MLNQSGITKTTFGSEKQILANVALQDSVGCIVPQSLGVTVSGKKIVKAGTPINIDLLNRNTAVKAVAAESSSGKGDQVPMNAVLLHNVDVTSGNANGTALVFGFLNVNMVEPDVATAITTAKAIAGASPLLTFIK